LARGPPELHPVVTLARRQQLRIEIPGIYSWRLGNRACAGSAAYRVACLTSREVLHELQQRGQGEASGRGGGEPPPREEQGKVVLLKERATGMTEMQIRMSMRDTGHGNTGRFSGQRLSKP
jgi:hypothetical protein